MGRGTYTMMFSFSVHGPFVCVLCVFLFYATQDVRVMENDRKDRGVLFCAASVVNVVVSYVNLFYFLFLHCVLIRCASSALFFPSKTLDQSFRQTRYQAVFLKSWPR